MNRAVARTTIVFLIFSIFGASATLLAATESDLAKVRAGISAADVEKYMGKPDRNQSVTDRAGICRLFVYRNVGRYRTVSIWFDCQSPGKVKSIDRVR